MKNSLLLLFLLIHFCSSAQVVDIPDANFKSALLNHNPIIDTNGDGEIQVSEANNYSQAIDVISKNISNLEGIEEFTNLTKLECNNNEITNIDISNNIALTWFECRNNLLTSLDVSELSELRIFNCNRNQISFLDLNENLKIEFLSIENNEFEEFDISKLVRLTHFTCSYNNISELDLTKNLLLESIKVSGNELNEIDVTDKPNLHVLECSFNNITNLDVSNNIELWTLKCGYNNISNLDLSTNLILSTLECSEINIPYLDISNNVALRTLSCKKNNFTHLDVTTNHALEQIDCYYNDIIDLDLSQNTLLTKLICPGNELINLDLSSNIALTELECSFNALESINVSKSLVLKKLNLSANRVEEINLEANINLTDLKCSSNRFESLDLSRNSSLEVLSCQSNIHLTFINIKNGNNAQTAISCTNLPSLIAVCVDDVNSSFVSYIEESVDHPITFTQNCSVSFETSNQIVGKIAHDADNDGCDASDLPMSKLLVITNSEIDSFATVSQNDGSYIQHASEGDFTTSIVTSLPSYFDVYSPSQLSSFVGVDQLDTINFCVVANEDINDLNITIYPISQAVPGFKATYKIVYNNVGSTILDGEVVLDFDGTILTHIISDPIESGKTANSLTFAFLTLKPFESRVITVDFQVAEPPVVELNDILDFNTSIYPSSDDLTRSDNTFALNQVVVGAYDPNDITCLEGYEVRIEDKDEYLHYLIRFQNTGTFSATNVIVKNELDDKLDWTSFRLEESSHKNIVVFEEGKTVNFVFDNIFLADSLNDEMNSHGYIAYKIKTKNDIAIGDVINNDADIFFDFNEPISTNTYSTEITQLSNVESDNLPIFSCYPNPAKNELIIESPYNIEKVEMYNSMGVLVLVEYNKSIISLARLPQGIYFIRGIDEIGKSSVLKVKKY